MGLLINALIILGTISSIGLAALYLYFKRQYAYWGKRNVPFLKPTIPFGNIGNVGKKSLWEVMNDIYNSHRNERFFGFWLVHRPALMINDPDLIKKILVQDFQHFQDHGVYCNEKDDPLSAHLFSIGGTQWKNLRAKLSPTFTSGKMKTMFPIVTEVSEEMLKVVDSMIANKGGIIEAKDLIARFGTDVISSCAFGIQANSLKNPNAVFREMGKKIFEPKLSVLIKNTISFMLPDVAALIKLVVTPKDVSEFFLGAVKETMDYRENSNVRRNDFMQLMIDLKNQGFIEDVNSSHKDSDPFTFEQAAAQAFIFYIGGFETSSGTLQFTLYHLAKNTEIQDRLRTEIKESLAKTDGKMTYESIHEMKYLGMVLAETLRRQSAAAFLNRHCNKEYKLPGTDLTIEKGTDIYIGTMGIHNDAQYYPNPEKFDPERFTEEEKAKRNNYLYLPFGEGPRFCIGQRFAFMQMRVAMVSLISKYRFDVCDKTPPKIVYDPKALIVSPLGGMHLKVTHV